MTRRALFLSKRTSIEFRHLTLAILAADFQQMVKMKASFVALLIAFAPGIALAAFGDSYVGKTTIDTGNMNIIVQPFRNLIPMVGVENKSDKPARCGATFSNGLQFSETRYARVLPGQRATIRYPVNYITANLDLDIKCSELQG
jgi:hypothetical protein